MAKTGGTENLLMKRCLHILNNNYLMYVGGGM